MTGRCECGGMLTPTDTDSGMLRCEDCSVTVHQIAANHTELLQDLRKDNDPAISALAETILNYDGRSYVNSNQERRGNA